MKKRELEGLLGFSAVANLLGGGWIAELISRNGNLEKDLSAIKNQLLESNAIRDDAINTAQRAAEQADAERRRADENAELAKKNLQQAEANAQSAWSWKRLHDSELASKRAIIHRVGRLRRLLRKSRNQNAALRSRLKGGTGGPV